MLGDRIEPYTYPLTTRRCSPALIDLNFIHNYQSKQG